MEEPKGAFSVRLPVELRKRVEKVAAHQRRSVNSQVIVLLERALENEKAETVGAVPAE